MGQHVPRAFGVSGAAASAIRGVGASHPMEDVQGAETASPTVETGTESSAGTQNTGSQVNGQPPVPQPQPLAKDPPFHAHPRWQQMQAQNRAMQAEVAQLRAWRQQQTTQQGQKPLDPETQAAHEALEQLLATHPKLKSVLGVGDQVQQLQQQLQQMRQTQGRGLVQTGRAEIGTLAKAAGLPVSDKALDRYEDLVAAEVLRSPELRDRVKDGDLSGALKEAWEAVTGFTSEIRRGETASLAANKAKLANLPPRPSGGVPGSPSVQPFQAKPGEDARGAMSRLNKMARDAAAALTG